MLNVVNCSYHATKVHSKKCKIDSKKMSDAYNSTIKMIIMKLKCLTLGATQTFRDLMQ